MKEYGRKTLIIFLIVFILGWPVYYLNIDNEEEGNIEEKQWQGVITLWDFPRLNIETGSRYDWITNRIRKFEKENPGVYIELVPIDWTKGPIKLEVGLKTGVLPDIAPVSTDFAYMNEDILEPLDDFFTEGEITQYKSQAMRAVTHDNKIWGVPFMMTTYVMYLNLDLFNERGVEPPLDGNWTYDEFVEKMKELTYDSDNDKKVDHYGFNSFIEPNYYNLWGIILSDGAEIIDKDTGNYVFYGDKAISGVEKVMDLKYKYKVTPETFGELDENAAWDMFRNEKTVAVYPTGTWAIRVLEQLNENGKGFDFTVANYPIGDKKLPTSLSNSVSAYGVFKQEDKGKLNMCVKLLKFISEDENQKKLEELGVFPAKANIKDIYGNNNIMKRVEDCIYYTEVIPRHENWKDIDRILQNQLRLALMGKKDPQKSINEAKKQIEQILRSLKKDREN